jgi:hypothetical protein
VQLHPLRRHLTLLVLQLHEPSPQFRFIHTVSFTSFGPSQSS